MSSSRFPRARAVLAVAVVSVVGIAALAVAASARPHGGMPETYVLPSSKLFPEGIGFDSRTGDFFVGGIGNGAVIRGNVNEPGVSVFSPAGADGRAGALAARPNHGRVFVGSLVGKVWVYNERSGKLLAVLDTGMKTSVMNDFAFLPNGTAFVTDTTNPYLWRITAGPGGWKIEKWLDFTGTPAEYVKGFNLDGIVASADGRYLVINHLMLGKLYRVEVASKQVTEVMKAGGGSFALVNNDGMELVGRTLYDVRNANALIVKIRLAADFSTGTVSSVTRNAKFRFPTGAVAVGNRMLVVNSQLDRFLAKKPAKLPFTITNIPRP